MQSVERKEAKKANGFIGVYLRTNCEEIRLPFKERLGCILLKIEKVKS